MLIKSLSIKSFRLKYCRDLDCYRVNLWVSAALSRNVRTLDLCLSIRKFDMLPCEIFKSKTLVVLKLNVKCASPVPGPVRLPSLPSVCLPSLKVLHLC